MSTATTNDVSAAAAADPAAQGSKPRREKLLTALLWSALGLAMAGVIGLAVVDKVRRSTAASSAAGVAGLPVLFDSPAFALTDQENRPFGSEQLRGRPFVATFIFTHCADICPMMTQKMATMQKTIPTADVRLVSFTVDAKRDTPDVLKEYARRFNADPGRWRFLTGTQAQMDDVARGMNVGVMKMADGTDQFTHSNKFFLVDGFGHVRGLYDSKDEEDLKKLAKDAQALAEHELHGDAAATGGRS